MHAKGQYKSILQFFLWFSQSYMIVSLLHSYSTKVLLIYFTIPLKIPSKVIKQEHVLRETLH